MHIIDRPQLPPHHCAITGQGESPRGFVDTGNVLPLRSRIIVSHEGIERLGTFIGMVDEKTAEELRREVRELKAQVAQQQQELDDAERFKESVEYTLNQFGRKVQTKPGPKKVA